MNRPILEIVTRHYATERRAALLARQQASLRELKSIDWVQTVLVDPYGRGIGASHERLQTFEPYGERVWILDDDDLCTEPDLVSLIDPNSDIQVFKASLTATGEVFPRAAGWYERRLICGDCGSPSVIMKRELWLQARSAFSSRYEGDFDFIVEACNAARDITWTDRVIAEIREVNRGRA